MSRLNCSKGFSATTSKCSTQLTLDPHSISLSILSLIVNPPFSLFTVKYLWYFSDDKCNLR
ncbi:unnamed protein product [Staurois parvus]|uniref:Uncharacterized protein n=1 Tax=Staurois parvus TaxID=386267 RepID=A0ABN9D6D2_9NEOB|nr:unnamed protein product [Staurois parvus]